MKSLAQVTLPNNLEVDILYNNGKLGYSFMHDGKPYGNAVKLPSKKITDIVATCLILFTNAQETKQALDGEQKN